METTLTLKQFITLALLIPAFFVQAQNYNNIEFIENKGQWDSRVKYKGDVTGGAFFIRSGGFTVLQHDRHDLEDLRAMGHNHASDKPQSAIGDVVVHSHAFNVDFIGASTDLQIVPDKAIPTYNNYFIGNDPSKWAGNCHIYQAITFQNVYPGVDVRYYTYNGTLKYDIIAKPGADISRIALKYEGTDNLQVKNKELVIRTSVGEFKEANPSTYQFDAKQRQELDCKYILKDNIVRFEIKNRDPKATIVIDPIAMYCSFSGSTADNWGFTATYGPDKAMYGGGIVREANGFPVSPGAFQTTWGNGNSDHPGPMDIGIIKLSAPNLSNRVYATYIGGSGNDQPHSLIVDPQGELIVAGRTNSSNYPLKGAGLIGGGNYDIVVTKLNAAGTDIIGSVRIGGANNDGVNISINNTAASSLDHNYGDGSRSEVIIDDAGNIYVASCTQSAGTGVPVSGGFPVTAGVFQPTFGGGGQDGVLIKFNPTLSNLLFSSFLGGDGNDAAYVLSLAANGDIFVAGGTENHLQNGAWANSFPGNHAGTIGPAPVGGIDGFVAQISNSGGNVIRSAFIGSGATGGANNFYDQVYGIEFDRNGFPYIMGQTTGPWPVINAAYVEAGGKQFIAKLQPDLSAYIYSTTFGTSSSIPNISPTAFLVDRCENVYVSGWGGAVSTGYASGGTTGMTTTANAIKSASPDNGDFYFFVLRRNAAGPSPLYASFFGQDFGPYPDHVDGGTSRFDANGVIYQAICANCGGGATFPTTPGAWSTTHNSNLAYCNLAMVRIEFNLAGVGAEVQSAIGGVPKDTAGCVPLTVVFTDQVRNAVQYIWNFGDGTGDQGPMTADTGYSQPHTFQSVGTYTVMLVAIDPASCNLRDTSYIKIRVGDLKANLAANYQKLDPCEQFNYRFHNLSTTDISRPFGNTSFVWNFGDGSPRVIAGLNDVDHTYPGPGTYNAWLIMVDTAYCNYPDSIQLEVRVADNVDAKFTTPPVGCAPYLAPFENTSVGGLTFQWDFGDPASGANNTSTGVNPTHVYNVPGNYEIIMIASDPNTCNKTDTARFQITVYEKPFASFSYSPVTPIENTPVVFTNSSSQNAVSFKWLFGDGDSLVTTSRADVSHQYNATGTFNACLVAFNQAGCPDDTCQQVRTLVVPALDVPNAFTPNSNDVNSKVFVRGYGIAKMRFIIWNRWGQKVFETNDRNIGWDGKVSGTVQPMDVYAYTLDVEFFDGTKATKKGDITLIR